MASIGLVSLRDDANDKLDSYTSTTRGYAFNTYDTQGSIDAPLAPADVLMANLLSLQLSARDVIPFFVNDDGTAQHLRVMLDQALVDLRVVPPFESPLLGGATFPGSESSLFIRSLRGVGESSTSAVHTPEACGRRCVWRAQCCGRVEPVR